MSIRLKIILILVPLIVCILILTGTISALSTRSGLVNLAIQSFTFKSNQFEQFINEQWELLVENDLTQDESFIASFKDSIFNEAKSLANENETILGIQDSQVVFATNIEEDFSITEEEIQELEDSIITQVGTIMPTDTENQPDTSVVQDENMSPIEKIHGMLSRSWIQDSFKINNEDYVGYYFTFLPQNLLLFVTITEKAFLKPVRDIIFVTAILILLTISISSLIIILFSNTLVNPLKSMVRSMRSIIETKNFETGVEVKYQDEIGQLSKTFNIMIEELDSAYKQIKQYAFSAILAKKNESKIRNIFQKYVPVNVINSLFKDPSRLLTGENRNLTLMFTDIRRFTTISESFTPEKLVEALNLYFEKLVDIITTHEGIIDKYIGDAIMAFFGAPVEIKNSPLAAMTAAREMMLELDAFNNTLKKRGQPQFITGIGINHGLVTVGNIGSNKKMDYTAIGDAVNVGSRLEGLTKTYKQTVIFSTSVKNKVHKEIPCRIVDVVQVKGKTKGEMIYTTHAHITDKILEGYALHNAAINKYIKRDFVAAKKGLESVLRHIPNDFLSQMFIKRCDHYIAKPPSNTWDGTFIMTSK